MLNSARPTSRKLPTMFGGAPYTCLKTESSSGRATRPYETVTMASITSAPRATPATRLTMNAMVRDAA